MSNADNSGSPPSRGVSSSASEAPAAGAAAKSFAGTVDSLITEIGDFLGDVGRTWTVVSFSPQRAAESMNDDFEQAGGSYITPTAYLLIASVVSAFMFTIIGEPPGEGDLLVNVIIQHLAEVMSDVNEKVAWQFVSALMTGVATVVVAWLLSLGAETERQAERLFRAIMWALSSSMFSFYLVVPTAIIGDALAIDERLPPTWYLVLVGVTMIWFVVLAPGLMVGYQWARLRVPRWPFRFVGAFVLVVGFVSAVFEAQRSLQNYIANKERNRVWVTATGYAKLSDYPAKTETTGGTLRGPVSLFLEAEEPGMICNRLDGEVMMACFSRSPTVEPGPESQCFAARLAGGRAWLAPRTPVETELVVIVPGGELLFANEARLCCQDGAVHEEMDFLAMGGSEPSGCLEHVALRLPRRPPTVKVKIGPSSVDGGGLRLNVEFRPIGRGRPICDGQSQLCLLPVPASEGEEEGSLSGRCLPVELEGVEIDSVLDEPTSAVVVAAADGQQRPVVGDAGFRLCCASRVGFGCQEAVSP